MDPDPVTVTVAVAVPPEVAFDVFTREIDRWWKRGARYRIAGREPGLMCIEAGVGGRLFEEFAGGVVVEMGKVTVWEPPSRLELEWRAANFVDGERTTVAVRFEPSPSGTRVTVQHRGWASLRADHPVRHGLGGAAFYRMIGLWWGGLMAALREHVTTR